MNYLSRINRWHRQQTNNVFLIIGFHSLIPKNNHFLPPGVACTTGLSHNPFTWRPLKDGKKRLRQKVVLCNHM